MRVLVPLAAEPHLIQAPESEGTTPTIEASRSISSSGQGTEKSSVSPRMATAATAATASRAASAASSAAVAAAAAASAAAWAAAAAAGRVLGAHLPRGGGRGPGGIGGRLRDGRGARVARGRAASAASAAASAAA